MDIDTVTTYRRARTRADLALAPGESFLAGGTWLMSEPQPDTTGFVDLTTLGWPDLEVTERGPAHRGDVHDRAPRRLGAGPGDGCRAPPASGPRRPIVPDAANALLASFKIWNTATVGGNVCRSFAAGAMVSLAVGARRDRRRLDPGRRRAHACPVADLVTGNGDEHASRRGRGAARGRPARARAALARRCCARSRSPSTADRARS